MGGPEMGPPNPTDARGAPGNPGRTSITLEAENSRDRELPDVLRVVPREVELEAREGHDAEPDRAVIAILPALVEHAVGRLAGVVRAARVADLVIRIRVEAGARGERDVLQEEDVLAAHVQLQRVVQPVLRGDGVR